MDQKGTKQSVFPAIRNFKDFDYLMKSSYEYLILLESNLAQLKALVNHAKRFDKKLILHVDLIDGLKADEHAIDFLVQEIEPAGIISTRNNVVLAAKKKGIIAIQRIFLLDTIALEKSYLQLEKTKPDYVEVLPGIMPNIIKEIAERISIPIISGGFIRSQEDVDQALNAGAVAITTTRKKLW